MTALSALPADSRQGFILHWQQIGAPDHMTILMVADDNTLQATLTGPDSMELCNTKLNPEGHAASCAELSRKR